MPHKDDDPSADKTERPTEEQAQEAEGMRGRSEEIAGASVWPDKPVGEWSSGDFVAAVRGTVAAELTRADIGNVISTIVARELGRIGSIGGTGAGAHVNSGPTGHANVPGHADFTAGGFAGVSGQPPSVAGAHVNSGPTGHANVPGHADFTVGFRETRVFPAVTLFLHEGTRVTIPQGGPRVLNVRGTQITRG